ncbi:hypothetical protein ACHWQZ_G009908 [Mnemiopsis leidyi]
MRLWVLTVLVAVATAQLVNRNVNRVVDLTTQIAKVTAEVEVENSGASVVSTYEVVVDPSAVKHLSYLSVSEHGNELPVRKTSDGVYEATLSSSLSNGGKTSLVVTTTFTHSLEPYPRAINQPDNQLVRFHSNAYYYSVYSTVEQFSKFNLGSSKIESFTPRSPSNKESQTVKYGPYSNILAKTSAKVTIHFENNSPFLTVSNLKRIVEVSHWGNIAVEEHYQLSHTGAKLKSQFSRLDFQRNPIGAPTAVKSFRTVLPASSKNVYYRDDIGNISTSNLRETEDANELEIRPRFPLFGGWQTKYYIGYSVPSYEMLSHSGQNYKLEFPFVDHSYDNLVIDDAEVRVILPEGASDFEIVYPNYEITREADEKVKTYLDTFGRPVLVFSAKNLEENHIKNIEIYYKFNPMMLLQEPVLVVIAFMVIFTTVIIFVRLDFSISVDENKEARERVAYLVEELFNTSSKIKSSVSDETVEMLATVKAKKDPKHFKNAKKEIDGLYKTLTDEATAVTKKIIALSPTLADRVAEFNRREGERKALLASISSLAEKVLGDKVSKTTCNEQENNLLSKLYTAQTAIEDSLAAL